MSDDDALRRLNALTQAEAEAAFAQCCAATAWSREMTRRRPYSDRAELLETADRAWQELGPDAWRDAFRGHPRLGEKGVATVSSTADGSSAQEQAGASTQGQAGAWSGQEQAGVQHAGEAVRAALIEAQHAYEARFGHIFLICATGRSATEMLDALRARMLNDADTELRVAADEQRMITRLRLERLLAQ
ncbi:2-oxo-4-hydroxy-4-carboxy-5-ureidoimidazoline decarboxylase [soil metagenome]